MRLTLVLRDEDGREKALTNLLATEINHPLLFVCPRAGRLTNLDMALIEDMFKAAGIRALVCDQSVDIYQVKALEG